MIKVLSLVLFCAAFAVSAQTTKPRLDADKSTSETALEDPPFEPPVIPDPPLSKDSGNATPDGRVFKPSEEISEDSPVAFPIDI